MTDRSSNSSTTLPPPHLHKQNLGRINTSAPLPSLLLRGVRGWIRVNILLKCQGVSFCGLGVKDKGVLKILKKSIGDLELQMLTVFVG